MANDTLARARNAKNDEFYTQYYDIEREVEAYLDYNPDVFRGKTVLLPCDDPEWSNFTHYFAQNFERLGLRKLISTSYAAERKQERYGNQLSLFETEFETRSPKYDKSKTRSHGKIFMLDGDSNGDRRIDIDDLQWDYLKDDGDFRSREVTALRDEADIIVTNPPFSLFREFIGWIMQANKHFLIIGNANAITYKDVFPLLMLNKIWLGVHNGAKEYTKPAGGVQKMGNTCWFSNLDHGRRHQPLELMTMADNLKYSKHKDLREKHAYEPYVNYDAIEVPYIDAIPSDYEGMMGVPISFLDGHCSEQFEILGMTDRGNVFGLTTKVFTKEDSPLYGDLNRRGAIMVDGELKSTYARILIRKKQ